MCEEPTPGPTGQAKAQSYKTRVVGGTSRGQMSEVGGQNCGMNAFGRDGCLRLDDSLCEWDENLTVSG